MTDSDSDNRFRYRVGARMTATDTVTEHRPQRRIFRRRFGGQIQITDSDNRPQITDSEHGTPSRPRLRTQTRPRPRLRNTSPEEDFMTQIQISDSDTGSEHGTRPRTQTRIRLRSTVPRGGFTDADS